MKNRKFKQFSVWRFLALGYLIIITLGSLLLILPAATVAGEHTTYLDALFTAASATCITGLVVNVTATHWTLFGQIVILFLIQLGGLGFMTFVSSAFMFIGKGMTLYSRRALIVGAGAKRFSDLRSLVKRIIFCTFAFEFVGACLLSIRFIPDYGVGRGIYYSIFHSISAFCNAGFDVLGEFSVAAYISDPLITLTLCGLILSGGLGFYVMNDIINCRFKISKFQLNTKVILIVDAAIIVLMTSLFLGVEWHNELYADFNFGQKLLACFANAVYPRTAGYFSTPPTELSQAGYLGTLLLMFIGGGSGSTAGGIKMGTFAVIVMGMFSAFRGNTDINIGKRRVGKVILYQALAVFTACLALIVLGTLIICASDPNVEFSAVLFECFSALGTVGLTMDLTPNLNVVSKIVIMILMYAGRVGILTIALSFGEKRTGEKIKKPFDDSMLIG